MKKLMMAMALAGGSVFGASERVWPQLPDGTPPCAEVSTNIPIRVDMERLEKFTLRLRAESCATNEVLVAVGNDANEDGNLSFEETAFVFGMDCGARYLVNYATGRVFTGMGETLEIGHRCFDPAWNLAKVVKRGTGAVGERISAIVEKKSFAVILR